LNQTPFTLTFLHSLQKSGIKVGLRNIRLLLASLGNPERTFPSIHVAGTNGKGSTSAMIAAILTASGYRTGLYTSPHLVSFTERIRIDGRKIPMENVSQYSRRLEPLIRRTGATFFEATTAIAFQYFADQGVDIAVIETGLGGRWDSTNVITPLVSVITSIGMEHQEYLGGTIRKIAFEKAGIIKSGVPCVVGEVPAAAMEVIVRRAARVGSPLIQSRKTTSVKTIASNLDGITAHIRVGRESFSSLNVAATGTHQAANARLALQVSGILENGPCGFLINRKSIQYGLSSLRLLTGYSGRLQMVRHHPPIIVDVAHNPDGIRALVGALREFHTGKFRIVFGVMKDKDFRLMINLLAPISRMFYIVTPSADRSRDHFDVLKYIHGECGAARTGGSVKRGIEIAIKENQGLEPILVTGSHFVVGEVMRTLRSKV